MKKFVMQKRRREEQEEVAHEIEATHHGHDSERCCPRCRHAACLGPAPVDTNEEDTLLKVSMPGLTIINGPSQAGKSRLLRYIFYKYRHKLKHGVAYSNTGANEGNLDWIPNGFKHYMYGQKERLADGTRTTTGRRTLTAFLNECLRIKRMGINLLGWVVIDDDMSGFQDDVLLRACTQTVHHNIWVVICTQHVNKLMLAIRGQFFQVAVMKLESKQALEAAYEAYGQDFYNLKEFKDMVLDEANTGDISKKDYRFLWRNKVTGEPWHSFKIPAYIPPFRLEYGTEEGHTGDATASENGRRITRAVPEKKKARVGE